MLHSKRTLRKFINEPGFGILMFVVAIMLLVVFKDYIFLRKLYLFMDSGVDSLATFYPKWVHVASYIREIGIPMWSFNCGMGKNIFPAGINNSFLLLLYLSGDNLAECVIYVEVLKFFLTSAFAYFYFRTMSLSKYSSMTGSLMIAFCGYMVAGSCGWYGHSSFVFCCVLWLWSFERLYRNNDVLAFPIAVAFMSSLNLFYVYTMTVFLSSYVLLRFFSTGSGQWRGFAKLISKMAALGLLGLCLNAVFIISPLMSMIMSPRVAGTAGYFKKLYSTSLLSLSQPKEYLTMILRFFSTDILGSGDKYRMIVDGHEQIVSVYKGCGNHFEDPLFYCSIPALILMPQLFCFLKGRKRVLYLVFALFWTLPLVFPYARYALNMFSGDYYKGGLNFFIPAIIVFMAVRALHMIERIKKINGGVLTFTAVILISALFIPSLTSFGAGVDSGVRFHAVALVVCYTLLVFMMGNSKRRATVKLVFIVLLIGELVAFSSVTANRRTAVRHEDFVAKQGFNDYTVEAVRFLRLRDNGFYRTQKNYLSIPYVSFNDSQAQGFYGTPSYDSFNQIHYIDFLAATGLIDPTNEIQTRWAPGVTKSLLMQSLVSVKYGLTKKSDSEFKKNGWKLLDKCGNVLVYENPLALPLGFTSGVYMTQEEVMKLPPGRRRIALLRLCVVPTVDKAAMEGLSEARAEDIPGGYSFTDYRNDVAGLKKDHLVVMKFSHNHIVGEVDVRKKKMMIMTIPYDPGWSVRVDGAEADLFKVDFGFTGVLLRKGRHSLDFSFKPRFLILGAAVSIMAACVYIALAAFSLASRGTRG